MTKEVREIPCGFCGRCIPGEPWNPNRDCRYCWLYHHDGRYRKLWGGTSSDDPDEIQPASQEKPVVKSKRRSVPCIHLGSVLTQDCPCPGKWTRGCGIHGKTTLEICKTCDAYEPE